MKGKKEMIGTMYFLYSVDGKEYINTCIGIDELARFLNRKRQNVLTSLRNLKKSRKKKYKIRGAGTTFTIISEDDLRKGI